MAKILSGMARRELIDAVRARYRISSRAEKRLILREFSAITGYHRKSAIRVLNHVGGDDVGVTGVARPRLYDEPFRRTLLVLWEASDRVCGKRLRALLPTLPSASARAPRTSGDRRADESKTLGGEGRLHRSASAGGAGPE